MAGGNPNDPNRGQGYPGRDENEPHPDNGSQQGGGPQPSGYPPPGNYPQQGTPQGYPPHGYQPYGEPGPQHPYAAVQPHRGALILVFGILGLVLCGLFGIAAFVMGKSDIAEMERGTMDRSGEGLTKVGYYLGMVALILMILGFVLGVFVVVLGGVAGA